MRVLMTGVDDDGRSCVIGAETIAMDLAPGRRIWHGTPYTAPSVPPPARPIGHSPFMDLQIPPSSARWLVMDYEPGEEQEMHQTDSVDLDIVLRGSIELILDDGIHVLHTGDGAIVGGVDHAWKAGINGCRLSAIFIGTPPP